MLACGGFESNAEMRARYLGPGWDLAKVRGTRYNTGAGIKMALDIGAMPYGHWSGCHAVGWDRNAPPFGDLNVGDKFQKHSYPLRHHGQRERRALRRRGRRLPQLHLRQIRPRDPGAARHVRVADLRPEGAHHAARRVPHQAGDQGVAPNTLEELVQEAGGRGRRAVPRRSSRTTTRRCRTDVPFNLAIKDGRGTHGPQGRQDRTGRTRSTSRRSRPTR